MVEVRAAGYVPYLLHIDQQPRVRLPDEKMIRLEPGEPVGGIVVDEEGQPLAGAKVRISIPWTETARTNFGFSLIDVTTGPDGRWSVDAAPTPIEALKVSIDHPQRLGGSYPVKPGLDVDYALSKGWSVRGRVTASDGGPIEGARVFTDEYGTRQATTDAAGAYVLEGLRSRGTLVTVTAPKNAPAQTTVEPAGGVEGTADFVLQRGRVMSVRTLDRQGNPIEGVGVGVSAWRGTRLIWRSKTDAEGVAAWEGAPEGTMTVDIFSWDYLSQRDVPLESREESHEIVLSPKYVLKGTVVDAETGRPISDFVSTRSNRVPQGDGSIRWDTIWARRECDGEFQAVLTEAMERLYMKIEAEGYETWISPAYDPEQPAPHVQVRLRKAEAK